MIRVEEIVIKQFRGIRDLTLIPKRDNFAVCGPNGTGKSGVVDALEFALTGNISRLSGSGTGGITVKDHGPHVDSRDDPEKASVTLKVFIPSLNKTATIHRTIKNAKISEVNPDTPDIKAVLDQVAIHPEFALSRREIIKYVIAEPGKRSKEVQALLRLDELEALRSTLQKIVNSTKKELQSQKNAKDGAANQLMTAMAITRAAPKEILDAANERRIILSLTPIDSLTATTSLKDGLSVVGTTTAQVKIQKTIALADLKTARDQIQNIAAKEFQDLCAAATLALASMKDDPSATDGAERENLLQEALRLYNREICPVCDTEWKPAEFGAIIAKKLKDLEALTKKRAEISRQLEIIIAPIEQLITSLRPACTCAAHLPTPLDANDIKIYGQSIVAAVTKLRKFLPIADTMSALEILKTVPSSVLIEIGKIEMEVGKLPEVSQQDAARDYLVIAQERLEMLREASLHFKKGENNATIAAAVYETYGAETTRALEKIYKDVEALFITLYRSVNDDENSFSAKLIPSAGKLGFDVDFYGRGFFPPGAYHSEGHQDGMGLCLYLALMQHLLGKNFTFSVLDDVLMSVDAGHRREVSKMLCEKFPDTQFVLTTHDEIWLRHMTGAGLIKSGRFANFRKWSVELGPTEWDDRDAWKEIDDYLKNNDVRSAAALLRHYLEHISYDICDNLRASVKFRGDARFTLGDLMPNGIGALRDYIKMGKASAQSWGDKTAFDTLNAWDERYSKAIAASKVEEWQVNAAVHFNAWATLDKKDFEPVVQAFKILLSHFQCTDCESLLYILPDISPETLRCRCPKTSFNLLQKRKESSQGKVA